MQTNTQMTRTWVGPMHSDLIAKRATAKKVSGEGHWHPAEKTSLGPKPLSGQRFDTPAAARKEAVRILKALEARDG